MSRMGNFFFECQEIAENNYNESPDVVIAEVERVFVRDKTMIPMAIRTTLDRWREIQRDFESIF